MVGLDLHDVVAAAVDDKPGGVRAAVQRVGGDDAAGHADLAQQPADAVDLAAGAVGADLAAHHAAAVLDSDDEHAVRVGTAGPVERRRLAVDGEGATSLLDAAPADGGAARVAVFNPGSNRARRSSLRLVNDSGVDTVATVNGVDDAGVSSDPVRVPVPAGEALWLTAAELEAGGAGFEGALGDGDGKWRLRVASDAPLTVMSFIEDAAGRLSNVSTAGRQ